MIIPMDASTSPTTPLGPMTRACTRALETEVTSLLSQLPFDSHETWLLFKRRRFAYSGTDAEHPTFIPMYTPTTLQAPRGHMTRPRTYAIGHKVNSLLFKTSLSACETWLLPHAWTLHTLRYNRDDHGGSKDQGQAWKRRRKKKQGQASGKPGPSGLCPKLPACLRAKTRAEAHVSLSHLPLRGLDYIYFSTFTSLGLALV